MEIDHSDLDERYFIDDKVYNCPFCNRNNVLYSIIGADYFYWTQDKICYVYLVKCSSCNRISMHLSYNQISLLNNRHPNYPFKTDATDNRSSTRFSYDEETNLDDNFFYSVPTSFFTLDSNIPKILRELFIEAEGCLKSNFLTGSSACARKLIYELSIIEEADGENYDDRIKSLKAKLPNVDSEYFDSLLSIQKITSDMVHEESYDGWTSKHLRLILSTIQEILYEIYVYPAIKKGKREKIIKMREEMTTNKNNDQSETENNKEPVKDDDSS